MSATIIVSSVFGMYTNNRTNIEVKGSNVGECLEDFFRQYPDMRKVITNNNGELRHNFDMYINGQSSYPLEMKRPVNEGDKLNLVMLIMGG
jgi:hypothetical protein